jgi:hypothetical protein
VQDERTQPGEALARALAARGARVGREDASRVADLLLALVERGVLRADGAAGAAVHGAEAVAEPSTGPLSLGPAGTARETRVRSGGRVALGGAGTVVRGALQTPDACNTGVCKTIGVEG